MRIIPVFITVTLLAGCSAAEPDNTAKEARAAFEGYVEAINSGDFENAGTYYSKGPDFHWIERGKVQYEKASNAAQSLGQLAQPGMTPKMTIDNVKVAKLADGAALVSAHFDFAMEADVPENSFAFDGWMTVGMTRQGDRWYIAGGQTGPGAMPSS